MERFIIFVLIFIALSIKLNQINMNWKKIIITVNTPRGGAGKAQVVLISSIPGNLSKFFVKGH